MSNPFYNVSGAPSQGSQGSSGVMRGEFLLVQAGFALLAPLTANTLVGVNSGGTAQTVFGPLTNGQLLIGSTGAAPVTAGLTGTTNQLTVTPGAGSITLSLPQNIHSAATPTFAGLTLTGLTGYTKANGASAFTASATIPNTDITGLGTMSTQNANAVAITGGTINGTPIGGTVTAAGAFTTISVSGNISLGANFISRAGTSAGFSLDSSNNCTLSASLVVSGVSANAFGGAADPSNQIFIQGAFAGSTYAASVTLLSTLIPAVNASSYGFNLSPTINKNSSGTHADFITLKVDAPNIAAGAATLTNATTLKITGAPSVGTNQRALWVAAGASEFDAAVGLGVQGTGSGLTVGAASTNNDIWNASQGAGSATLWIGNASINVTSDERVKEGVRLWNGDASAILRELPVKSWDRYLSDAPMGGYEGGYVGFTAQDLHKAAPWSVNTQGDTGLPWQARYEFLNGIIVKGWQQHDSTIGTLVRWAERAQAALAEKGIVIQ